MKIFKSTAPITLPLLFASFGVFADQGVGGDETRVNRLVNSNANWTILTSEFFQLQSDSFCIATGSADSQNPNNGNNNNYRFTLSLDNPNPAVDGPCERQVEHDANAQHTEEVSSTCTFRGPNNIYIPAGNHRIYWLARIIGAAPVMTVPDNSMTFVCQDVLLDNDGRADGD